MGKSSLSLCTGYTTQTDPGIIHHTGHVLNITMVIEYNVMSSILWLRWWRWCGQVNFKHIFLNRSKYLGICYFYQNDSGSISTGKVERYMHYWPSGSFVWPTPFHKSNSNAYGISPLISTGIAMKFHKISLANFCISILHIFKIVNTFRYIYNISVISVPANGLALLGARESAGPVITKFGCHIYMGTVMTMFECHIYNVLDMQPNILSLALSIILDIFWI